MPAGHRREMMAVFGQDPPPGQTQNHVCGSPQLRKTARRAPAPTRVVKGTHLNVRGVDRGTWTMTTPGQTPTEIAEGYFKTAYDRALAAANHTRNVQDPTGIAIYDIAASLTA